MIAENIARIQQELGRNVRLVVVSKFRTTAEIMEAYNCGQRAFAENKVQLLVDRRQTLPQDIEWHLIGHLQSNKVKYIAPFVNCIQSVDSLKLLGIINAAALRHGRVIDCLLQIHIADEEHKFGLSPDECRALLKEAAQSDLSGVRIRGLMGMATNTEDQDSLRREFSGLAALYSELKDAWHMDTLSMGMSGDYKIAVECGSNMVRIGSLVFA